MPIVYRQTMRSGCQVCGLKRPATVWCWVLSTLQIEQRTIFLRYVFRSSSSPFYSFCPCLISICECWPGIMKYGEQKTSRTRGGWTGSCAVGSTDKSTSKPACCIFLSLSLSRSSVTSIHDMWLLLHYFGGSLGPIMSSGRTCSSNSSAVKRPRPTVDSLSVRPSWCAFFAALATLS